MNLFQIQFRWQMLLSNSHETLNSDNRCLHDPQLIVAREKGEFAKQKRHGTCHLVIVLVPPPPLQPPHHLLRIYIIILLLFSHLIYD